ncbi:MAG: hypothetical protein AB1942_24985 [Pseudomonadota bacterium]
MKTPGNPHQFGKPSVWEVALTALIVAGLVFTDLFLSNVAFAARCSAAGVGFAAALALGLMSADRRR